MRKFNEITCDWLEHVDVKRHVYGLRTKTISNAIRRAQATTVITCQTKEHVDARSVVVQQTRRETIDLRTIFSFSLPVTKIKIQFTNRIIDTQIPPKTFVYQKSIRMFNTSVKKII